MTIRDATLFASAPAHTEPRQWYHIMDVPGFDQPTPGAWDLRGRYADYIGHVDLAGKSVLDIGCASGFLSFSAEASGASEVVSFDMDHGGRQTLLPFRDSLYYRDHEAWVAANTAAHQRWKNAYWAAHEGYQSRCKVVYGDIYHLPPGLGTFDVVLLCSVLEHMADPISALASVARHAADRMVLSVWIPDQQQVGQVAYFLGSADRPDANGVFWAWSLPIYEQVLAMLGFAIESQFDAEFLLHTGDMSPRTAIVARRI